MNSTNLVSNRYGEIENISPPSLIAANRHLNPLKSIRAHKWLAAAVIGATLLIGLPVALLFGHRQWMAEATIRVSPSVPTASPSGDSRFNSSQEYRDFVQEQVFEINSYETVSAGLDLLGSKRRLWQQSGESDRHAAERLAASLTVEPVADSYLIRVGLDGGKPEGLADIVNAVVKAYLSRKAKQELDGADIGIQLLQARTSGIEQEITTNQEQLDKLTQLLGVSSLDATAVNPYDKLLADDNEALARAHREVILAQAHLSAVRGDRDRTKVAQVEAKAQQLVASDGEATAAKRQLIQQRETALLVLSGLGPNHPGRKALEEQIGAVNKELANLDQQSLDRARSMLGKSEQATTDVSISAAESSLEQSELAEKGIEQQLASLKIAAASFGAKFSAAVELHNKIGRLDKELQDTQERISLVRLERLAPGVVALDAVAMSPDVPKKNRRRTIAGLFAVLALMLGVATPTAIDLVDPKLKTAEELRGILGFPPLGLAFGNNGYRDQQSLRRIALGIMRERRTHGIRTFVFTHVRNGDIDALVFALAAELSDLGSHTISIQVSLADSSWPRLDRPPNGSGALNVFTRATSRLFPRVPETGALQAKPASILQTGDSDIKRKPIIRGVHSLPYVRQAVDRALTTYDIVLLATRPLLTSADAIAMVQLPAGAILVARADEDERRDVGLAARELEKCAPPVIGAILLSHQYEKSEGDYRSDLDIDPQGTCATQFLRQSV